MPAPARTSSGPRSPDVKARISAGQKRSWTPERRAAQAARLSALWAASGGEMLARLAAGGAKPEAKKRHKDAMRRLWADPSYQGRRGKALPAMSPAQRRVYKKLRRLGIGRDAALAEALKPQERSSRPAAGSAQELGS